MDIAAILHGIQTEMQTRLSQLLAQTPARELEKNLRALMQHGFAKLDLATREQLDLQGELLSRAHVQIAELEARIAMLEQSARAKEPTAK